MSMRTFNLGVDDRPWWKSLLLTLLWLFFGPAFSLIFGIIIVGGRIGYFIRAIPYFIRQKKMKWKGGDPKEFREKCVADENLQNTLHGLLNYWGESISFSDKFYENGAKRLVILWEITALWVIIALGIYGCVTYSSIVIPLWVVSLVYHTAAGVLLTHAFFTIKDTHKLGFQTDD